MKKLNFVFIFIFAILLVSCGEEKQQQKEPDQPVKQSTIYLESSSGPDENFYFFRIIDKSNSSVFDSLPTHAVAKRFNIDPLAGPRIGGTNPYLIFHSDNETLIVTSYLSSPLLPRELRGKPAKLYQYLGLEGAPPSKEAPEGTPPEEYGFLFSLRRLDQPFQLVETFRGRDKIREVVNKLLSGEERVLNAPLYLRRQKADDNAFEQIVQLILTAQLKEEELPQTVQDYIKH